jgi:hypothetical protein
MSGQRGAGQSLNSTTVADLLERVLDKGVVIAGDIRVKLVDIELLSIQIRLVICSVDKAKEMGMDWWANQPVFSPKAETRELELLREKVAELEKLVQAPPLPAKPAVAPPTPLAPFAPLSGRSV